MLIAILEVRVVLVIVIVVLVLVVLVIVKWVILIIMGTLRGSKVIILPNNLHY
jgi:hypothetical protein